MFEITFGGWAATLAVIGALVAFELWHSRRKPHAIGVREAAAWSVFYIGVAVIFGVVLALVAGWDLGGQYFAGYIVEKSLSADNLFVFVIIMSTFAVPAQQRARLLMMGIVGALILRSIFIALGAAMLDAFSFTYLLFGLLLTGTAVQLFRHRHSDPSLGDNVLVGAAQRLLPVTPHYDEHRLITRSEGRRTLTPLFLALLAIASTDLLFALDSIPAVFGVTRHAYVVFAANAFALLGLRALFFLVSGLLDRLVHLSTGLAVVLAFIGVKLVLHFAHLHSHAVPEVSTWVSLCVIATVLALTTIASLVTARRNPAARAHAGSLRGPVSRRGRSAELGSLWDSNPTKADEDAATLEHGAGGRRGSTRGSRRRHGRRGHIRPRFLLRRRR
jgi:tellurite resistance protein TerC